MSQLREWLDKRLARKVDDWIVYSAHLDPVLYVHVCVNDEALRVDLETCEIAFEPASALYIDISGRHAGDDEVRVLLEATLLAFDGVVNDGFTPHCWTLDEIRKRDQQEGHPFFDYQGWFNENKGSSPR